MDNKEYIEKLNSLYFKGNLSNSFKQELEKLPIDRPDVFAFVERAFGYIQRAKLPARDMSVLLGEILGSLLARLLPDAWEGRVPPITLPGRHILIDTYIKNNPWITEGSKKMLDIGCGFPPYTTLDTAKFFPDWEITAADPSLPEYLVHDSEGNYATLNSNKEVIYFQPSLPTVENWNKLLKDTSQTKKHFQELLDLLLVEKSDNTEALPRLLVNPIKSYENDKLSFINGGIGELNIDPQGIIRCFNVLIYFDDVFYQNTLDWFNGILEEKGLVIIGANWAGSIENYYNLYQKDGGVLTNREFGFSIDNINPIGVITWYANHNDDRQTKELIEYIRIIRSDKEFMKDFYSFTDERRKKYKICPRDKDGNYGRVDPSISPSELWGLVRKMLDELNEAGYNSKAVEILKRAGINARVNEVGFIAIQPSKP